MDAVSDEKVFGLSESQIARRVKAAARATDLPPAGRVSAATASGGMAQRQTHPPAW